MRVANIIILIDGLGWEFVKDTEFLSNITSVRAPLPTMLGYSAGAVPTCWSGLTPPETDHWALFYYDEADSLFSWTRWFRWFPFERIPKVRTYFSHYVFEETRRRAGYTGYFQIYQIPLRYKYLFSYSEKKSIFHHGLNRGETIFDQFRQRGVEFFMGTYPQSDQDTIRKCKASLKKMECNDHFLYLHEFDGFLHAHCKNTKAVSDNLAKYQAWIDELISAASGYDSVQLTVFSDHGMTPVNSSVDMITDLSKIGLSMPQDYVAFYDSTLARFWPKSPHAERVLANRLGQLEYGRLLTDHELTNYRVLFESRKYGKLIFLLNPGVVVAPSFMGQTPPNGMHGYAPEDSWSDGIWLTNVDYGEIPKDISQIYRIALAPLNAGIVTPRS